ncbi:MAG: hypothetical protein RBS80_21855 [Thermoguttaceae bacterium]|jgi:hypothetical protein|nr:hypothetical protein [Thermoguttaceae bacterium]
MNRNVLLTATMLTATAFLLMTSAILAADATPDVLRIGWATVDITPDQPVVLRGQFHARVSEGVMDPVTVTALALESVRGGAVEDWAVLVSCDLVSIADEVRDRARERLREKLPDLDPMKVLINATHTHSAPAYGSRGQAREAALAKEFGWDVPLEWADWGIELDAMPGVEYREFAAERIAQVVEQAWNARKPGGVGFGLGHAVVGHNRLVAYDSGRSGMYGATDRPDFSHVEGYEDHSVNLLFTWDADKKLTGVVVNVACPSQVSESIYQISADFWHDTREELRRRLGEDLFVLPQASAAGDQSPHLVGRRNKGENAEQRMERITGRNRRQQIAVRIADAVTATLPHIQPAIEWNPVFAHRVEQMELSRRLISEHDVAAAEKDSEQWRKRYDQMRREIEENPEIRKKNKWYTDITRAYRWTMRVTRLQDRFELQQTQLKVPHEVHVLRIGDMALATNPFELYIDYGTQIKTRSKAVQTFIVQLTGTGTYLPTQRSVAGGAYGAVPASTEIGPEGGRELVEQTLALIESLWQEE